MVKVLITGSSGFIGSYLVRDLAAAGHAVAGVDLADPRPPHAFIQGDAGRQVAFESGDLTEWSTIVGAIERQRPDAIVHNASFVRPDVLAREPLKGVTASFNPAMNVFEAARLLGVKRVVYVSTIGVFPRRVRPVIDGDHPVIMSREGTPDTFYGAAKIAAEAFAFAYYEGFGLDVIIVRPSAVYGFGMNWPIYIKTMVESALAGQPVRFETGGDMPRDYTHAEDVAQMIRLAVEVPRDRVVDRVFHAGTGREPVTAADAARVVRALVAEADIEIGPGLADDEVRDAATRGRFDIDAAKVQLGYRPRFAELAAGVANYIEAARAFAAARG